MTAWEPVVLPALYEDYDGVIGIRCCGTDVMLGGIDQDMYTYGPGICSQCHAIYRGTITIERQVAPRREPPSPPTAAMPLLYAQGGTEQRGAPTRFTIEQLPPERWYEMRFIDWANGRDRADDQVLRTTAASSVMPLVPPQAPGATRYRYFLEYVDPVTGQRQYRELVLADAKEATPDA